MKTFAEYLARIENVDNRSRIEEILNWVGVTFPNLTPKIAWNQPMFTDHETFIIGFSVSKNHLAIAPESVVIKHFSSDILKSGYDHTNQLIRIKWKNEIDYALLEKIIAFNILDKADCPTFWRKL